MKQQICAVLMSVFVLAACEKKVPGAGGASGTISGEKADPVSCIKEEVTTGPVKVGETGIVLPAASRLCFAPDQLSIKVELPAGFNFVSNKTLPAYATYSCNCSASGSACQVFYAEGLGFGCLQSTCSGACTGKFGYKGYTVDKVVSSKSELFSLPDVQQEIAALSTTAAYEKFSVYGVSFWLVNDEKVFLPKAHCDCDGTKACTLKTISLPSGPVIYFCEGSCNGCELTVS